MSSFYVFSGKKIKRVFFLIAAALLAAGVVYVESDNITVFSESNPSAIYSVPTDKKSLPLPSILAGATNGPSRSLTY